MPVVLLTVFSFDNGSVFSYDDGSFVLETHLLLCTNYIVSLNYNFKKNSE